jgi:threonine dehydrogenase-like Zn-dependent dehydrogenase
VPETAVAPLPDGLPPARAVLAANMETALNGVWDAKPSSGNRVLVIGAGVVGMLVAWLCHQIPGVQLSVFDVDGGRERTAAALDLPFTRVDPAGADADLVIHASGSEQGLRTALASAGMEATVVELSWYGNRSVSLPLGEAFHSRRLTLKSSQVGRIPPERASRWSHRQRMAKALELLLDPRLDALVSGESAFDDLPRVMGELSRDGTGTLCHRIRYGPSHTKRG